MKKGFALAALGITALMTLGAGRSQAPVTFADLPKGDVLKIQFESSGCFHQERHLFEYRRLPKPVLKVDGSKVVRLTPEEVAKLDHLLAFYRGPHSNGCTTVDTVTLTHVRNGKAIASEKLTDGSCSYDRNDFLRLDDLARRAEPSSGR